MCLLKEVRLSVTGIPYVKVIHGVCYIHVSLIHKAFYTLIPLKT